MKNSSIQTKSASVTSIKGSNRLLQDYLDELITLYHYIDFRGIAQLERFVSLELDQVFVPLKAFPISATPVNNYTSISNFFENQSMRPIFAESHDVAYNKDLEKYNQYLSPVRVLFDNGQPVFGTHRNSNPMLIEQMELASTGKIQGEPQDFGKVLAQSRQLVLLGDPGAGKSTLVKWLARSYALGRKAVKDRLGLDEQLVPIVFSATGFAEEAGGDNSGGYTINDYVEKYFDLRKRGLGKILRSKIESGQAFLLIDGLDEIPDVQRRLSISRIIGGSLAACADSMEGTRCLITSRKFGYNLCRVQDVLHWELAPFGQQQIECYVRGWSHALERTLHPDAPRLGAADREAHALLATINEQWSPDHETLQGFASNPLLLTIVALVRWQLGILPERRARLYDHAITTLVETWNLMRTIDGVRKGVKLDVPRTMELLEAVALWMHTECTSGVASRREILARMAAVLKRENFTRDEALATAESYLDSAARWAGILIERGPNVFGFAHLTFQEYLAARALTRTSTGDLYRALQPRLFDPRWHEVVLLVAGYLGEIQGRREECTLLVERIRDTSDRLEPILHRYLFLAADIIGDRAPVSPLCHQVTLLQLLELCPVLPIYDLKERVINAVASLATITIDAAVMARAEAILDNAADWRLRAAAVLVAATAPDKAIALLAKGMCDGDPDVRGVAAALMARTQGADLLACAAKLNSRWFSTGFRTLDRKCEHYIADALALPGVEAALATPLEE